MYVSLQSRIQALNQENTELLRKIESTIRKLKEIRPKVRNLCFFRIHFRLELEKRLENGAHHTESAIRGTEEYIQTSFEISTQCHFRRIISLARSINSHSCDDHEHWIQYNRSFHKLPNPPILQIVLPAFTVLCSWLTLQDTGNQNLLLHKEFREKFMDYIRALGRVQNHICSWQWGKGFV